MKSILDPSFRYIPSVATDLRKTFARVRREMRERDPARASGVEATTQVVRIDRRLRRA